MHSAHYRVAGIREIKCWTFLDLEDGGSIGLRRTSINKDLVRQIRGKRIKVSATALPPSQTEQIEYISYRGQRIYPIVREEHNYLTQ